MTAIPTPPRSDAHRFEWQAHLDRLRALAGGRPSADLKAALAEAEAMLARPQDEAAALAEAEAIRVLLWDPAGAESWSGFWERMSPDDRAAFQPVSRRPKRGRQRVG